MTTAEVDLELIGLEVSLQIELAKRAIKQGVEKQKVCLIFDLTEAAYDKLVASMFAELDAAIAKENGDQ